VDVIDVFSGCGGTSLGFRQAGFRIRAAIDLDRSALDSFTANFPKASTYCRDIRLITNTDLTSVRERAGVGPFVLIGCAPCQPFSKVHTSHPDDDPRRTLLAEFSRAVRVLSPEAIFLENVPGIQRGSSETSQFSIFLQEISALGYSYDYGVVKCTDYGVPQTRLRLVLVAAFGRPVSLLRRRHSRAKELTVRHWIGNLPPIECGQAHPTIDGHVASALSETNLKRIRAVPAEGSRMSLPTDLMLKCHEKHRGHTDVYGRMRWDAPASAITTRCISLSNGRFGHPSQDRAISLREAARLQTFPDSFSIRGSVRSGARQIGNAVPPRMAKFIARDLRRQLEESGGDR